MPAFFDQFLPVPRARLIKATWTFALLAILLYLKPRIELGLLVLALFFLHQPAWCQDNNWVDVAEGYAIDKATVQMTETTVCFWLKIEKPMQPIHLLRVEWEPTANSAGHFRSKDKDLWSEWFLVEPGSVMDLGAETARFVYHIDARRLQDPTSSWAEIPPSGIEVLEASVFVDNRGVLVFYARERASRAEPFLAVLRMGTSQLQVREPGGEWRNLGSQTRLLPVYRYLSGMSRE